MSEVKWTKQFFSSKEITLSEEWLEGCIGWYKGENSNYTVDELHNAIYEQWLLLDLRDVSIPVLPANIRNERKCVLNKNVCLQIMSIVDISKPKYTQIQNIRGGKLFALHNDENSNGKRVLQLTLSDGVQEVLATEYKPINILHLNLNPGTKIKLSAPAIVRRGQIMLEPGNITILGGEVEEILISNAPENVLAKALSLPLNEKPASLNENGERNEVEEMQRVQVQQLIQKDMLMNQAPVEDQRKHSAEIDNLLEAEVKASAQTDLLDETEFDESDFDHIDKIASSTMKAPAKSSQSSDVCHDYIDPDEMEEMMKLDEVNIEQDTLPMDISESKHNPAQSHPLNKPPMTIKNLLSIKDNVTKGKFKIHGRFAAVVEKLGITDTFSMRIIVEDDSGCIEVAVHSDVISEFLGCDPEGMLLLKQRALDKDEIATSTIFEAMSRCKDRLASLDNDIDILIEAGQRSPVLVNVRD